MAGASFAVPNFLGGERSQFAQGRFDQPDYHFSLNACANSYPVEIGPWVRRPGTMYAGHTRGGAPGRVLKFDFQQAAAYTLEFTDGFLRFRTGASIATANDAQTIIAVSSANPAVVQTSGLHGWSNGNTVMFPAPGPSPLLENRQFVITVVDTTHVSLADALTGASINGSTLGSITVGTLISRAQELVTPYAGGVWANIRPVQAETTDLLLTATVAPQAVTVPTLPVAGKNAIFAINPANFLDGPYLDQVNGSLMTPSGVSGVITLTLSAQLYAAATAYKKGDLATSGSVTYQSLQDANVGNTPSSSPTFWQITSPGVAVGPNGFQQTDIGRLVRLFNASLGAGWASGTTYNSGDIVSNASLGYRSLLGSNLNNTPSATSAFWEIYSPGWTWGKITAISTAGLIAPGGFAPIGSMNAFGTLAAAFDGVLSKQLGSCAATNYILGPDGLNHVLSDFIGLNFTGSPKAVSSAVVYPSSDHAFEFVNGQRAVYPTNFNLRGKATVPASSSDGTLLANVAIDGVNNGAPVTLISSDGVTTFNYIWIEVVTSITTNLPGGPNTNVAPNFSQVQFFGTSGIGGTVVSVEILGAPLPNTATIPWLLGAFSATSGYPTCGAYHEGRIWLGGAIPNRFDAGVSNGITGNTLDFAPTDNTGQVLASSAISYTLNSDSVNPILWMQPDLQGILIGTQADEWLVQAPTTGPISAINIAARRVTAHGSANIQPCRTEHTTVFVQRFAQKLLEYFPDVFSGKFSAPNLADKAQHLTRNKVAELAYTSAVTPILWGRDLLGALFGVTYKRDSLASSQPPTFYAWHRHSLGSGRVVESVCPGPSTGGNLDTLTMVTNDSLTNIRHVELLTDAPDELSPLASAWFLDDSVSPTSTSTTNAQSAGAPYGALSINGLWHLNGKTVQVFAGGLDCGDVGKSVYPAFNPATTYAIGAVVSAGGVNYKSLQGSNTGNSPVSSPTFWLAATPYLDFVVSNGSISVPYGDSISAGSGRGLFTAAFVAAMTTPIAIGFTYTSQGQLLPQIAPAESGARNGPAFGKLRRVHRYTVKVVNSLGLSFGTSFSKMFPANFRQEDGNTALAPLTTKSGIHHDTLNDNYTYEQSICWQVSRPYPANIVVIGGNIETQDQ